MSLTNARKDYQPMANKWVSHCETLNQLELLLGNTDMINLTPIEVLKVQVFEAEKTLFSEILSTLEAATGLELCIAGGAVRDVLHGKSYKGLDIEILNYQEGRYHNDELEEDFEKIANKLKAIGATCLEIFNEYKGHCQEDAGLDFVVKFNYADIDMDLILRECHPKTPEDVVALYDMNLNQVAFHNSRIKVFKPVIGNRVESTGKIISLERLTRMMDKYPEYDFMDVLEYTE